MTTENSKNDLISHKGQKRRAFTLELKKKQFSNLRWKTVTDQRHKFNVEPKCVREWKENFGKLFFTKSSEQRLEDGGRKCFDSNLEERLVA